MGTCSYTLTQPCWSWSLDNYFLVSTTNEFQGGNLEVSYVKAVHVKVFNLKISLIKGRKVVVRASASLPGPHTSSLCRNSALSLLAPDLPVWFLDPRGVQTQCQFLRHTLCPSPGNHKAKNHYSKMC